MEPHAAAPGWARVEKTCRENETLVTIGCSSPHHGHLQLEMVSRAMTIRDDSASRCGSLSNQLDFPSWRATLLRASWTRSRLVEHRPLERRVETDEVASREAEQGEQHERVPLDVGSQPTKGEVEGGRSRTDGNEQRRKEVA